MNVCIVDEYVTWDRGYKGQNESKKEKSRRGMDVYYDCCVLSDRGLSDGPIPRPEE
jgi:hypothetical protein